MWGFCDVSLKEWQWDVFLWTCPTLPSSILLFGILM